MATIFLLASSVLFLGALVLGWLAGDRADRKAVFAIFAALLGTSVAHASLDGQPALTTIALFDGILLAFLFRHAMTTRSHWPLWFTGVLIVIFAVEVRAQHEAAGAQLSSANAGGPPVGKRIFSELQSSN